MHRTVCFLGHSVLDNLRLLLEECDCDLHRDFNHPTVIPMWKTVRGLNFPNFVDGCLSFLDHRRCDVIVWQMAGNDLDSMSSVSALTVSYMDYAHKLIRYCEAKIVIICEALPHSQTRHCSSDEYYAHRQRFNSTMREQLLKDKARHGPKADYYKDSQVWFWSHKKIQGLSQLCDGVHLTRHGLRRLYFSLHMVVKEASKRSRIETQASLCFYVKLLCLFIFFCIVIVREGGGAYLNLHLPIDTHFQRMIYNSK